MKINFYYSHIDSSVNDLMIIYNSLYKFREYYYEKGIQLNLVNVTSVSLSDLEVSVKNTDVCIIDITVNTILSHESEKIPYNTVILNIKDSQHYISAYQILISAPCCKILFAQSFDLHWHGIDLDSLNKFDALFWLYEKEPIVPTEVPIQYQEYWFSKHENPKNVWSTILSRIDSRAEIPFCLNVNQSVIKKKFFDYTIAGCNYQTRVIASESLRKTSLVKAPFHYGEYLSSIFPHYLNKMRLSKGSINKMYISFRKYNYKINIERSLISFACGSGLLYPVRKFFQIPSYGSLLLSYPCRGFKDYGFIDGVNCIITTPEDAGKASQKLVSNKTNLQKIIQNGFNHVLKEHSVENRIKQLMECIKKVGEGKKINAQYLDGKYTILEI